MYAITFLCPHSLYKEFKKVHKQAVFRVYPGVLTGLSKKLQFWGMYPSLPIKIVRICVKIFDLSKKNAILLNREGYVFFLT
jgi:hypothetical protein